MYKLIDVLSIFQLESSFSSEWFLLTFVRIVIVRRIVSLT